MKLFKILKNKNYFALFIFLTLLVLFIYPFIQLKAQGGIENIEIWLDNVPKINLVLIIIFAISFGLLAVLQVYNFKDKSCRVVKKSSSFGSGVIGSVLAVAVPACPACIGVTSLFFPAAIALSVGSFFVKFSTLFLLISLILMLLSIFLLGGFRNV